VIRRSLPVLATLATAVELASLAVVIAINRIEWLPVAMLGHLLAARIAIHAAAVRRDDLTRTERDAVAWIASLVPVFGPVLGWWMPRPPVTEEEEEEEEVVNAHEMFERYEEHVKPHQPDYERTLFTGDYARDVARELDAESYYEVLRHGNTDQKRNALRRLAALGEPKHFVLIRRCLLDPLHEVRLYAYAELEKSSRFYEEEIADLSRKLARRPRDADALLAMARIQFRYAASGIHDEGMAEFYYKTVVKYARRACEAGASELATAWLVASACARIGATEDAMAELASLPAEHQELPESCLVRASIHYEARDFDAVRAEADRIDAGGGQVPAWMRALHTEAGE